MLIFEKLFFTKLVNRWFCLVGKDRNQIIHESVLWFIYSSITCRILVKVLELTIDIKCTGKILSRQKKVDGNCSNFKSKNWEDYTYVYVIARGLFAYN